MNKYYFFKLSQILKGDAEVSRLDDRIPG